ncbi:MAG: glycosyltransferase [archaeon]
MPKVSVIIPTYNRAELLSSAITSVLNQTFQDFEIIIVDDASKDNTQEVISKFNNRKIKYLYHETNRGEAGARNTGILNSNGQYIAFLDDDDEWFPEKLRVQVDILEKSMSKVGLVYSGYVVIDRNTQKILNKRIPMHRGPVYEDMLYRNFIGAPSTVILRRECIERIGLFDENIAYGLDHDLWIRIAQYYDFDYIKECLAIYCIHENRLSDNPDIRLKGLEDMIRKYGKHIVLKNKYYRGSYLSIGVQLCNNGDIQNGIKALANAIRTSPFEIRCYFYLGCALLGAQNFKRLINLKDYLLSPLRTKQI